MMNNDTPNYCKESDCRVQKPGYGYQRQMDAKTLGRGKKVTGTRAMDPAIRSASGDNGFTRQLGSVHNTSSLARKR
jgi:hypothetical protein